MSKTPPQRMSLQERSRDVKDEDKLFRHQGLLYPTIMSPAENLEALKTMEARADDVMLVAYPKCGFNWMVAVLRKIIATSIGERESAELSPLIEFLTPEKQKVFAGLPSPRVVGTHLHPDLIPTSFKEKKTKVLVVWRNPKDTLVSYFHFMNKNPVLPNVEWDKFFADFMTGEVAWGSYFDQVMAWDKRMDNPNVKIVTFEELKVDLATGIREISEFFGYPLTEEQVQTIYSESTFSAMSANNGHGNMGKVFFRKGEIGDWTNNFTDAQSQQMDEEFNKRLAGTKLGAKLNYDTYCKNKMGRSMSDEEKFYRHNGILYSIIMSPLENLEALKTLEARTDDVVLVAYPKCGFNWTVGVVRKIISAATGKKPSETHPHIEFLSPEKQKAMAQESSPRLLGTHLRLDDMHPSFLETKAKILVIWRNPKDTLVSFYHFMNKNPVLSSVEWDKFFSDFMAGEVVYGSYFDFALYWEKLFSNPNVKMITFEDLKKDLSCSIKEISSFFGFSLTEEQVQTISAESTFGAMKENAVNTHGKLRNVVFRKGEVGDWKNHFSEAQSQQMDQEFNKRLAGTNVGNLLNYDTYCK